MKYVGKQKVLAFAIVAALASASAQATVRSYTPDTGSNESATAIQTNTFAKELKFDDANTPPVVAVTPAGDLAIASVDTAGPPVAPATATDGLTTGIITGGGAFDIISKVGTGLSKDKRYFVRYQLSAGEWTNGTTLINNILTPGAASVLGSSTGTTTTIPGATFDVAGAYVPATSTKGGFVIPLNVAATAAGTVNDRLAIDFAPGQGVVRSTQASPIADGATVTLTVSVFEDQVAANNNDTTRALSTVTTNYFKVDKASTFVFSEAKNASLPKIDVTQQSAYFDSAAKAATAQLCSLQMYENKVLLANGTTLAGETVNIEAAAAAPAVVAPAVVDLTKASLLTVTGDFAASADGSSFTTAKALGNVFLHTDSDCGAAGLGTKLPAATLAADKAVFNIGNDTLRDAVDGTDTASYSGGPPTLLDVASTSPVYLCMTVNGTSVVTGGEYKVSYTSVPGTTAFSAVSYNFFEGSNCANLVKNGSSASVDMVLASDSPWGQVFRITNPSSIKGKVYIKAISDDGTVYTAAPFELLPGQSSGLFSKEQIVAMTNAKTVFELSPTTAPAGGSGGKLNKLRLWVDAEFGSGHNGVSSDAAKSGAPTDGVILRAYVTPSIQQGGAFTQY